MDLNGIDTFEKVTTRLKETRERTGWTRDETARRSRVISSYSIFCAEEQGTINYIDLRILCELYNVSADYILGLAENEKPLAGRWENDSSDIPRCSECGYMPEFNRHIDDYYYSDFCPNCGATMEKGGGTINADSD